ncbi:MAG TPA: cupin domain-containing protein [Usitatibacter sp.]|nr:cupin domain-containing protein [Usitatibacter sp.]
MNDRAAKRVIDQRVVNIDEMKLRHLAFGGNYECDSERVGPLVGARQLGYSYDVVPPGRRACPFHSHRAEEEMFFIVRGEGTLRYGAETRKIRAGDFICCPTGGPETAHQIVNDSGADLAYISVSTMMPAEVCEYPDSGKIGSFGVSPEGEGKTGALRHMTEVGAAVDYWKGEI